MFVVGILHNWGGQEVGGGRREERKEREGGGRGRGELEGREGKVIGGTLHHKYFC